MGEILITGGGGLAGLNTARAFAEAGVRVVITARHRSSRIEEAVERYGDLIIVEPVDLARGGEVLDLFSRYRFEGVVHAAQAHQHAQTRAANRANYDMLFNCLESAEATDVKRFVLVSSIVTYAGLAAPFTEDARFPVQPTIDDDPDAMFAMNAPDGTRLLAAAPFETTVKRALEHIALDYATPMQMGGSAKTQVNQRFSSNHLDVAVLRISTQFGPGYTNMGSPLGCAVHSAAGKGDLMHGTGYGGVPLIPLWDLIAMAPLLYVRDTASALVRMMQTDSFQHRIYNLSSGYTTSPREQLQTLYRVMPDAEGLLAIDPETLRAEPYPTTSFNADLLAKDTGWSSGYSLEEALEDYIGWLQNHEY
jgi:nucleoside-diphosphate-sugar epimerase